MNLESVRNEVSSKLSANYEAMLLTFYGAEATTTKDGLILIGDDYGSKLYVNPNDGHVRSIDDTGELPSRFINSSIDQLARFLAEYERVVIRGPKVSTDEERREVVKAFRQRLRTIDSAALDDPDNWWATIVEQLHDGFL